MSQNIVYKIQFLIHYVTDKSFNLKRKLLKIS